VVVRAHPGLVGEVDGGAHPTGLGADGRVGLGLPARHRLRVLLRSPVQRPLGRQPELAQQSPHADLRQPHRELPADQLADHGMSPQRKAELQLAGVVAHDQGVDPLQLGPGQRRRPSRDWAGLERLQPSLTVSRQPAIDRRPGYPQRRGDVLGMSALFDPANGADAQLLQGLVIQLAAVIVAHAADSTRSRPQSQLTCERLSNTPNPSISAQSLEAPDRLFHRWLPRCMPCWGLSSRLQAIYIAGAEGERAATSAIYTGGDTAKKGLAAPTN